ncbi:FAD-dependent oxidoreductase [Nocardioides acrostichi]|uniref:D-amino-acid oxidase n=1 Tax=Nocardioides acrostichi TaxID=2784339 RepID=A0A930V175_9ACTN|nr:FAD-dependent oxidoreductase [Nocardioides acrostichi]MBF4162805.1 FAD-binding oxidoreductase [Nocardioides acrostichi]
MARVVLVGAGVVGLSCAVRLLEAGHRVDVLARDLGTETTSGAAAAIWYPYRVGPQGRVTAWSARTRAVLSELAAQVAVSEHGVRLVTGTEVRRHPGGDPWWAAAVDDLARTTAVPAPYAEGWTFTAPVIEMPRYLPWLAGRVRALGGTITRMALAGLPRADVVVDCAGLGARRLAVDTSVHPVRGQVVRLRQVGLTRWWIDDEGPTYVIPRGDDIVVGGTADEDVWSRTVDPGTARAVLDRAVRLVPELAGAEVLGHRVGLRPARPTIRLETVPEDGRTVVHCYGHGGAGVTVSWGCADEVVSEVTRIAQGRAIASSADTGK